MGTLTKPYTFTAGTDAVAAQVNADIDTLFNWVNGGAGMWADGSVAFSGVPLAPNTDPTNQNHLTRKRYVDNIFSPGTPWSGNATVPAGWTLQGGGVTTTLNGQGQTTVTFPRPFTKTLQFVGAISDNTNNSPTSTVGAYFTAFNPSLSSVGFQMYQLNLGTGTHSVAASATARFVWWAVGI